MTEIVRAAVAGTDEKSDIVVSIEPNASGIVIELHSTVKNQYGAAIEASIREVLEEMGVHNARIVANDRGALDCVLRARVETAVLRGRE